MSSDTFFTHKGISFPTVIYSAESLSYVENEFRLLDDDVLNIAYPQSGSNWMMEILGWIRHEWDPSWVRSEKIGEWSPWIETFEGLKIALKYPPPRLLAAHLPFSLFPKSFLHSKAKVIYTLRNPKDVLILCYHYSKSCKGWKDPGTLEEYLEEFLIGNVSHGSWFEHVKGWLQLKNRDNVFFITFEDLEQNLRSSIERICHFLGKELKTHQIDSVMENTSFQTMKNGRMAYLPQQKESVFPHKKGMLAKSDDNRPKVTSGDWKNYLTVAQSERFDRFYHANMQGLDLTFPWD
ncbi:sulfotransferase 2B1-like isoform X2 [Rhineura floridana]|nr:sulfotransferase 2B1-like isoform X2 [Rhineura floridana]